MFRLNNTDVPLHCNLCKLCLSVTTLKFIKEFVDGLNAVDKSYIYQLMSTVQRPGLDRFDS